jgi:RNA polymerase sigma factor (sigma-70 family)
MPDSTHTNAPTDLPDQDLLRRFVLDADESAFAEIVRRYQRLVMGICRRVTGDQSDAEDAFQAVFVALARRPRGIRRATSLSNWLYTVAWRTSHRLVRKRKKQSMETLAHSIPSDDPDPLDKIAADQNADVLHAELNLLPKHYRQVLVMAYFAQQTSQQIADQLHVTKGTVDGRIRQARNILRVRLARRGIALGVLTVVSTSLHSVEPAAAIAPGFLESTIHLGSQTLSSSVPGIIDLSHLEPLIRPEFTVMNLKVVAVVGACLALIVGAAGMAQVDGTDTAAAIAPTIDTVVTSDEPSSDVAATVVVPARCRSVKWDCTKWRCGGLCCILFSLTSQERLVMF